MNIRRFVAANSRAALREVRDALGGDAVILANRAIAGGVEILAAGAGDLSRLTSTVNTAQPLNVRSASSAPAPLGAPLAARATAPVAALPPRPGDPNWLTEAQIVRTRKRIASLLDEAAQDGPPEGLLSDLLSAAGEDSRTTLSPAARRNMPLFEQTATAPLAAAQGAAPLACALGRTEEPTMADVSVGSADALTGSQIGQASQSSSPAFAPSPAAPLARAEIANEMRSMRGFIEDQLANLAWRDGVARDGVRMRLLQDLLAAGLSPALARSVIDHLPAGSSYERGREWISQIMQRNLICASSGAELTDQGGVFALVGPTGVGKTTTAAKMAARFAVKHGVDQLALITTDAYRIGAQDQLRIYGKILGIAVQTIHDQATLASTLHSLRDKKLVLIDTAGLSQRDDRVAEQIAMLRGVKARRLMILNATVQTETLEETVKTYAANDCAGCILTKIDEAVRLGGVLDVAVRHRLKLHYVSNGQRVPEDLHYPNPAYLVHRALRVSTPSRVFDVTPADSAAWLGAVAQSAQALGSAAHV